MISSQVNRQYLCVPTLNTLNVLLGTLNQVQYSCIVLDVCFDFLFFVSFQHLYEDVQQRMSSRMPLTVVLNNRALKLQIKISPGSRGVLPITRNS